MTIFEVISQAQNKAIEKARSMFDRALSDISDANQGLKPNFDYNGLAHAPIDGYCVDGETYAKGQFIPMNPFHMRNEKGSSVNYQLFAKTIVNASDIDDFINLNTFTDNFGTWYVTDIAEVKFGQLFTKLGKQVCYCNARSYYKSVITAVKEHKIEFNELTQKGIEGKHLVTGKVLGIKEQETEFGFVSKMIVKLDNGCTVYGSIPKSIELVKAGDSVTFSATFTASEKDDNFSFYKRPTKAVINQKIGDTQ